MVALKVTMTCNSISNIFIRITDELVDVVALKVRMLCYRISNFMIRMIDQTIERLRR